MEFPVLNDQLRSLVHREYPEYIPIPSLAESSEFGILYFLSPKSVEQSRKQQSWLRRTFTWPSLSQADSVNTGNSTNSPKLISLGWLFDHCPDNSSKVNVQEDPICIHGKAFGSSQLSGGMQVGLSPVAGCVGSTSFENINELNLGKIMKISLPYPQVSYWLKRLTPENSQELFKEAKKGHLFVIHQVLTAEHLKIAAEDNSSIEGSAGGTVSDSGVKATGSWKRNKGCRLSRPKSMGRYAFAYKCGKVKLKKNKKQLGLVGLQEFYGPFQNRFHSDPPQSQSSSQEEETSSDEFIHVKMTEDSN